MKRGDTVGPYEIVQRLGGQNETAVYSASRPNRAPGSGLVAIKVPLHQPETIAFFRMKGEIAAIASHPSLVRTIEVNDSAPLPYIAMELIDGLHLSTLLARGAPIHPGIAAAIGRSIACALHHLHTLQDAQGRPLNVVHLDVNARHVMLTREGEVKLLDFGVMSDRIQTPQRLGPSQDIHALGVLLGEMVQETADQFLYKIIQRAIATRPEDRFQTAREMADALEVHLLTYANIRPELAIRQMLSPIEARALAEPSVTSSDIFFSTSDTRARTIDVEPKLETSMWSTIGWIALALMALGSLAFVGWSLWQRY